ncbi:2-C-methyl-D-erythritol 4-phosphate cytidylyltransferase [Radiobacillus kanasensis]|uniref:2-C-methyl-D-erythritol 4-phosphate cytidylyltransferase n=1 Tax=Radiobacillus kanasensis TaxID=2844358 RepID=UPI001E5EE48E|nr:2-C-methyl-D-erythritol 4-phosphate cytidylyltransferase [Radiobacillus kanasensis]UFT99471.1 2-C-methyl-D-erythritol 4-phosphate cytidylyltransferase [Radiobacillus kanasensis]
MFEYHAIVLAAGEGKRMNVGENKQFVLIGKQPLIIHTLDVFNKDPWCSSITLVVSKKDKERMEEILATYKQKKDIHLTIGGAERQESVYLGLRAMEKRDTVVFVHDGARPFVSMESLHHLAEAAYHHKAALLAVPVTDTIKQRNGQSLNTLDRKTLWAAQTPQAFHFDIIFDAHKQAAQDQFLGTDDTSLVERLNIPVEIVMGSYDNMKLTTPEDLKRAQAFLKK